MLRGVIALPSTSERHCIITYIVIGGSARAGCRTELSLMHRHAVCDVHYHLLMIRTDLILDMAVSLQCHYDCLSNIHCSIV
jgi:hypothetical protein